MSSTIEISSGWNGDELTPLLVLNQAAVPAVNSLNESDLKALLDESFFQGIAHQRRRLAGFLLAFLPGAAYQSENYRWFCDRYQNFAYVDRIIVGEAYHGQGVGRALYQALCQALPENVDALACEVNLQPPNPRSQAFHQRMGFVEVGQQQLHDGAKQVSLLVKTLS